MVRPTKKVVRERIRALQEVTLNSERPLGPREVSTTLKISRDAAKNLMFKLSAAGAVELLSVDGAVAIRRKIPEIEVI